MPSNDDVELEHWLPLYQSTIFYISPESVIPSWDEYAIITAFNPLGKNLSLDDNLTRQASLCHQLASHQFSHYSIVGSAPDGSHSELSAAVCCSLYDALHSAVEWKQNAIFWVSKGELELHFCGNNSGVFRLGNYKKRVKHVFHPLLNLN